MLKKLLVAKALVRTSALGSLIILGIPVEPEELASNHGEASSHCRRTSSKVILLSEETELTVAIGVSRIVCDQGGHRRDSADVRLRGIQVFRNY